MLIRGLGPIPGVRHGGRGDGHVHWPPVSSRSTRSTSSDAAGGSCRSRARHGYAPDWTIIRSLFRFGLPTGIQGIAMNVGGVLMLSFIGSLAQSAAAQAAFAVSYSRALLAHHVDVDGTHGRGGRGGRTEPRRREARSRRRGGPRRGAHRRAQRPRSSDCSFFLPARSCSAIFGMHDPAVVADRIAAAARAQRVGTVHRASRSTYTGGLQGTGDTKSPLYISICLADRDPARHLLRDPARRARSSRSTSGSRSSPATRRAARSACCDSTRGSGGGSGSTSGR